MAIYHLHVKVIGRKAGSSAVASAAYRSASRMRDERLGRVQDFSGKPGYRPIPDTASSRLSTPDKTWANAGSPEGQRPTGQGRRPRSGC